MFITLEGVEGSGKTTVAQAIMAVLKGRGYDVLYTREPGGNKIAEQIREVILDTTNTDMDGRTEALLYAAARRQHLVDVIAPALSKGQVVLCDRFIDSSIAYQGYARGIGALEVEEINDFAIAGMRPDLTIFIDVKPEIGLKRISQDQFREINRLDLEQLTFHQSVYDGYLALARKHPQRIQVIAGEQPVDGVVADVTKLIEARLQHAAATE
ncbi:MAG: dTMP kinase [Turicibacter sp.]|nr:dTMP kinase [Turicibacter sp.]